MRKRNALVRVVFGGILLAALFWHVGIQSITTHIATLDWRWLLAAGGFIVLATFIGAYNRFMLIRIGTEIRVADFLPVYWLSWAAGLVIPGQVGDIALLSVMMRRRGMHWHASLGRSLLDKIISFIVVVAMGIMGLIFQARDIQIDWGPLRRVIWPACALSVAMLAVCWYIPSIRSRLARPLSGITHTLREILLELAQTATQNPGRIGGNLIFSTAAFTIQCAAYWCMFCAFGVSELSLMTIVPIVAVCSLVAYVPVSFNGLGTVEATGVAMFGQLGINASVVVSAFICLRLVVLAIAWIPATIILMFTRSTVPDRDH